MSKVYKSSDGAYIIECPGCKRYHCYDERWEFNGDFEKPTFTPSYLSKYKHPKGYDNDNPAPLEYKGEYVYEVCHSFVTDGKIQFLNDCTHEFAGQTLDLPDIED